MAEFQPTVAQQHVIDHKEGALLVSAAAGSGKTSVLVNRVLQQVCDKEHPANIDEFLIITFSEAAAAEMRAKIMKTLSERQAADPENRHLQRQSARVCAAQISTVHAFCSALLHKYCTLAGLPADFRVCDADESEALLADVLEDVLTESYESIGTDADFAAFVNYFGYGRDDRRLKTVLTDVYEAVRCREDSFYWLDDCEKACELTGVTSFSETPWGDYLIRALSGSISLAIMKLREAMKLAETDPVLSQKYLPSMQQNLELMQSVQQLRDWDEIVATREIKFAALSQVRKCDNPDIKELASDANKEAREAFRSALKPFYAPSAQLISETRSCAPAIRGLCAAVRRLDSRFTKEKRRRKLLDFSDLEHETIRLIYNRQKDEPTEIAKEIGASWREIMVDEFQDSNAVQERIFKTLSQNERNRFMVGDVKQSIYRFRKAEPEIFLQKYETYETYREGVTKDGEARKILLSENFRSRPEILSCVNDVFSLVMSKEMGELDYTEEESLKNGATFPELPQQKVELHCIGTEAPADEDADAPSPERVATEAEFVAARIAQLLAEKTPVTDGDETRPCTPDDIVILLRSPGNVAQYYKAALQRHGIRCVSDRAGDVLKTTEVETLFSILQIIDNPMQDIPLLSAMASPVFAFSPEELAQARAQQHDGCYYDCLLALSEKSEKLTAFLSWLSTCREQARELGLCELLDEIFKTTSIAEIFGAMPDGQIRKDNLHTFLSFAASYEQRNGPNLGGFNRMVCSMLEREKTLSPGSDRQGKNAVQIVSVHHSKGLEYPIVILADMARKFNRDSLKQPVLLDDTLYIGTNIVDPVGKSYYSGVCKQAISKKMTRQADSEEMRNLYVAMTRAKDMLIMTYCKGKLEAQLKKLSGSLSVPLNPEVAAGASCIGDWVLQAALCRTESGQLFAVCGNTPYSSVREHPWLVRYHRSSGNVASAALHAGEEKTEKPEAKLLRWQPPDYPYAAAVSIPSKLTATQLKGRNVDREAAEQTEQTPVKSARRRLSFTPKTELTGAEKGNATHLFMQFVRYECCTTAQGVAQEKERLVSAEFLTPQQANAVDTEAILRLFESEFGKRILSAQNVKREFKFSLFVDAGEFLPEAHGEQVMLQGVVDCFWQDADGLVIVDYKTDRVANSTAEKTAQYTPQVQAYCKALSRIYKAPVKAAYLYFFDANRAEKISV